MLSGPFLRTARVSSSVTKYCVLASLCGLLSVSTLTLARGQETTATEEMPARQDMLITKDGLPIGFTYFPSRYKQDASVVVLLHGLSGTRLDWGTLPNVLQKEGFAVITVDLRGHGQSKGNIEEVEAKVTKGKTSTTRTSKAVMDATVLKARDYDAMVLLDMEAVKHFIYLEHQKKELNMNKTAFIGAGMGAAVALTAAAVDWQKQPHSDGPVGNQTPRGQDVHALVLLTPDPSVPGLPLPDTIRFLRDPVLQVAMLFVVGKKDKLDRGQTKKQYDQAVTLKGNDQRMYLKEPNTAARGTGILDHNTQLEGTIVAFLKKHLQSVPSVWRDRESRVGRKRP